MKQSVEHIFPAQSTQNWATAAAKELEKGSSLENLRVKKEGIEWAPYFSSDEWTCWQAARLPVSEENFGGARHWVNMPRILVEDASQSNAHALEHLQNGAEGIVFDLPTDFSDVGRLLNEIEMPYCAVHFLISANSKTFFAAFQSWVIRKFPSEPINTTFFWKDKPDINQLPNFRALPNFRGAGVIVANKENAADQLANALYEAVNRIEQMNAIGFTDREAATHISFSIQLGADFFLETVKLRALRVLWNTVLAAYQIKSPQRLFIHAVSNAAVNTTFQPHGNLIKETYAAMAAILGGCDGLTIEPEDHANATMVRMARNTSSVLREESFFSLVADPLAGSYMVEQLTKQLAAEAWKKFQLLATP